MKRGQAYCCLHLGLSWFTRLIVAFHDLRTSWTLVAYRPSTYHGFLLFHFMRYLHHNPSNSYPLTWGTAFLGEPPFALPGLIAVVCLA